MQNQIFIQSLAIFALLAWGVSYQFKDRKNILLSQLIGSLFYVVHYFLLGATTGAFISILVVLRLGIFYFKKKGNWVDSPIVLWLFLILSLIATILTFTAYWAVFAFIGSVLAITATWQEKPTTIRRLFIPCHLSWITYNVFARSYGGVIAESVFLVSTIISLYRKEQN